MKFHLYLLIFNLINFFPLISLGQDSSNPPQPPDTPPPDNKTKPGGGLDTEPKSCQNEGELRPLIPERNPVLTISNKPSVFISIPDDRQSIESIEFWVNSEQEKHLVNVTVPMERGIIQVKSPVSINIDQYTPWYFKVTCKNYTSMIVHGWFKRVSNAPKEGAWYDILENAAIQLQNSPQNNHFQSEWNQLLESIGAEMLVEQRILQ